MATLEVRAGSQRSQIKIKRPKFSDVWSKYPVHMPAKEVYQSVGGEAYELYKQNPAGYANACALRLSIAFNNGGLIITSSSTGYKVKGGDGKNYKYLLRVKDMISFVKANLGQPDLTIKTNGQDKESEFMGKNGILIFSVTGWRDASGHVTLWNGRDCGDSCYFTHPADRPDVKTTEILFWELI